MAKLVLTDITSGYASTTAVNANNALIEAAFENTLSRDGTLPNSMLADLDMNGNLILNSGNAVQVSGFTWEGPWITAQSYQVGDIVEFDGAAYMAIVVHTSDVFATDLAAAKWQLFASAALPSQTSHANKFLQTSGSTLSWEVPQASEVSYTPTGTVAATTVQGAVSEVVSDLAASSGSSLVGFIHSGTGAAARTMEAKARDIVSRDDFAALSDMWAASTHSPKIDSATGKVWLNTDPTPLDYSTSRAGFVYQSRDTAAGGTNELIPGAVFQFRASGSGTVDSATELSQTIWQGQLNFMEKTGDGSGHAFTAIGELGAVGAGGYNELGLFQGEGTNKGSALGTMSGVEMLLKDSPDGGTTTYSTKMQAVVGRIARYDSNSRGSYSFYASSEGTLAPNGIIGVNASGGAFQRGFDFGGASFSTGEFGLAPNNTFLAWLTDVSAARPIIGLSSTNNTVIATAEAANKIQLTNSALASRLEVDNGASDAVLLWVGGALKRVGQGVADSAGTGYRTLIVPN